MWTMHIYYTFLWIIYCVLQDDVTAEHVTLSHDGPVMLGGTITFTADLYSADGKRPSGSFTYHWRDSDLINPHEYESMVTTNTTSRWSITYPPESYKNGTYEVEVIVKEPSLLPIFWHIVATCSINFDVTPYLNGNITILQSNRTIESSYVSSLSETHLMINLRKGDYDYITKKATSLTIYWFINCINYGQTNDFKFNFNFTNPDTTHHIGVLILAPLEQPTTTISPSTTPTTTFANITSASSGNSTDSASTIFSIMPTINTKPSLTTTASPGIIKPNLNGNIVDPNNITVPYVCTNSAIIPLDPDKTYGYFNREISVRAPITNVSIEGTNWIQPWDMLSLNVTCKGSGPFNKCLQFHRGEYNVTGNETCNNGDHLQACNFSIIHYFLEPSVYTILVMLKNDVSEQIYPLRINIYKVTTKPQLSVILVPVSCTLIAIVLIIFGVAYYIQSRARFTIEVADFNFGQNNPEIEYKTFGERLRDSFNSAVRPGNKRISGYKPLGTSQALQ